VRSSQDLACCCRAQASEAMYLRSAPSASHLSESQLCAVAP
jgi:hypothetical protein